MISGKAVMEMTICPMQYTMLRNAAAAVERTNERKINNNLKIVPRERERESALKNYLRVRIVQNLPRMESASQPPKSGVK